MPRSLRKVKVIDQSQNPPRVVDEGKPSYIASKWIPKMVGTLRYIERFPEKAKNGYIAATREGVHEVWLLSKSNHGKNFPAHMVQETPDGCYGLFYLNAARIVSSLNAAVQDGAVNEGCQHFRFEWEQME